MGHNEEERERLKTMATRQQIEEVVCKHFEVTPEQVKSKKRLPSWVMARHILAWLLRQMHEDSYHEIALYIGHTNPSSALCMVKQIEDDRQTSPELQQCLDALMGGLNGN